MGAYIREYRAPGSYIPEEKKEEYLRHMETLLREGGMMFREKVSMFGKNLTLLRKFEMGQENTYFDYNYFEDDIWETAGVNRKDCCVWSEKVGWKEFSLVLYAAYTLTELYVEGVSGTIGTRGGIIPFRGCVGWINYLFNEKLAHKNDDPWPIYESCHYHQEYLCDSTDWNYYWNYGDGFTRKCEIYAVEYSVQEVIETFGSKAPNKVEKYFIEMTKAMVEILREYKEGNILSKEAQIDQLLDIMCTYYQTVTESQLEQLFRMMVDNCLTSTLPFDGEESPIEKFMLLVKYMDAPALIVKMLAEQYDMDFWELWEKGGKKLKRENHLWGRGIPSTPSSTMEFLDLCDFEMIPFWTKKHPVEFSQETKEWFEQVQQMYEEAVREDMVVAEPIRYIMELLYEADQEFYGVYAFADFFYESIASSSDKRYMALWKVFEKMVYDPQPRAACYEALYSGKNEPQEYRRRDYRRYRLKENWSWTSRESKYNVGRKNVRMYMALMGNRELRKEVLGF